MHKRPSVAPALPAVSDITRIRTQQRAEGAMRIEAKKRALQIYARLLTFWDERATWVEETCGAEMVQPVMHEVAELLRAFPVLKGGDDDGGEPRSA